MVEQIPRDAFYVAVRNWYSPAEDDPTEFRPSGAVSGRHSLSLFARLRSDPGDLWEVHNTQ